MKNSLAEAGIISDPKSFAVGKRHLVHRINVSFLQTVIEIALLQDLMKNFSGQYLKRFRSISFLKTYTPMEAMYGFFSASSCESPKTVVSTA